MPAPTQTLTNVLVGSANFYLAAENSAGPADSVNHNDVWGSPWTYAGVSQDGLTLGVDRKEKKHMVDELDTPVVITVESTSVKVMFKFAEATLENFKYAAGGGTITTQPAAVGVIGKKTLVLSQGLDKIAVGFEGLNPQGFYRRIIIPKVISVGKIKTEWDRSKNKQIFAAEFEAVCPVKDISIYDKTAVAL